MYGLNERGKSLKGARILAFGLTYKADTSDARESPAIHVIERLVKMGADVTTVDPHVAIGDRQVPPGVVHATTMDGLVAAADCVVMLTDHSAFDMTKIVAEASYALDTRRCLPKADNVELL